MKRLFIIVTLLVLLISCGGGGGGPTGPEGIPKISNLQMSPPVVPRGQAFNVSYDYLDEDNDLQGGIVRVTTDKYVIIIYPSVGIQTGTVFSFPITGAFGPSGSLGATFVIGISVPSGRYSFNIQVIDRAGHASNILSAAVDIV